MNHEPHEQEERLLYRDEAFRIRGAVYEVNGVLGVGFLEAAYQECLALEFARQEIPFVAQPTLRLEYKGTALRAAYIPDFVCFDAVLVELKAVSAVAPEHRAQVINYLKAANLRVGLLVNFGGSYKAQIARLVH